MKSYNCSRRRWLASLLAVLFGWLGASRCRASTPSGQPARSTVPKRGQRILITTSVYDGEGKCVSKTAGESDWVEQTAGFSDSPEGVTRYSYYG